MQGMTLIGAAASCTDVRPRCSANGARERENGKVTSVSPGTARKFSRGSESSVIRFAGGFSLYLVPTTFVHCTRRSAGRPLQIHRVIETLPWKIVECDPGKLGCYKENDFTSLRILGCLQLNRFSFFSSTIIFIFIFLFWASDKIGSQFRDQRDESLVEWT